MAEAAVPFVAYQPSTVRFFRFTNLLIDAGTKIIRGLFDSIHHPSNLANALQINRSLLSQLKARRILSPVEWKKLFPSSCSYGKSEDFDLTIFFKLLRNICNLTRPSTGWDKLPDSSNISVEADIARIHFYRNTTFAHITSTELSEKDFKTYWEETKKALLRIVRNYSAPTVKEWEERIDMILSSPITESDARVYRSEFPGMLF